LSELRTGLDALLAELTRFVQDNFQPEHVSVVEAGAAIWQRFTGT